MDMLNFLTALAGILIGIFMTLITTFITMRYARRLEEEAGAFRKPEVGLAIFNCRVGNEYPDNEEWFFIHPGGADDYAAFPIKFTVFNEGDSATDEILISIHIPKRLFWARLDQLAVSTYPSLASEGMKQSIDEIGNFTIISSSIPSLSPTVRFDLVVPFSLTPTLRDISVPAKVEDVTAKVDVRYLYDNAISVSVTSGDLIPSIYQLRIGAISASSVADGVQKYISLNQRSEKKTWLDKIRNRFSYIRDFKVTNFVAFDIESQVMTERDKMFLMKSPDRFYRRGWFNLSSSDIAELKSSDPGYIVGVLDLEEIPKSQYRVRAKKGNLIEEM